MIVALQKTVNRALDRLVRPEVHILHRSASAFHVCGVAGVLMAILLTVSLVMRLGLSPWVMVGLILAAVVTFFMLIVVTKIITGEERIIYYHHEIAVIVMTAFLLRLLRQPILPYLDLTILGIGLFLVCGRFGCFMVGCCHGRPHSLGVCYREEHAAEGFSPYLVGVRLFPIQVVESLYVLCIVVVSAIFILSGRPPGTALAWYVITYDLGRFWFEFLRGDPDRPYYLGFSQPQWISLFLIVIVLGLEGADALPFHSWHFGAATLLVMTMIAVALRRRFQKIPKHQLLHPRHVKEFAEALGMASDLAARSASVSRRQRVPAELNVGCTSLGIQISAGKIKRAASCIDHYALSQQNATMNEESARILARLILRLKYSAVLSEVVKGDRGVYHFLVHPG